MVTKDTIDVTKTLTKIITIEYVIIFRVIYFKEAYTPSRAQ